MGRLSHHLALGGLTLLGAIAASASSIAQATGERLSLATAYLCLALLAVALAIGPWRALASGRPVLNNYLRRDIGIWAGLNGLAHVWLGTLVSMNASYVAAYVKAAGAPPTAEARYALFGFGALAGYLVGALVLLLLALSNDRSLRRLGAPRWKRLHRASYAAFGLTALHGLAFQVIEARARALTVLLAALTLGVLALHLAARRAVSGHAREPGAN